MNWVGGSRNRFMVRNDTKKQREFFEKKKMQRKMKRLGIPMSPSSNTSSCGSVDLVTLFIVNQIAAKEEKTEQPNIRQLSDTKMESRSIKDKQLELPMSPCSPSRLNLMESQPYHSVQVMRKRKHCIPEGFKCRQLSPVMESNHSDNSASDYKQHHRADARSPFSSGSSSSSGLFPTQQRGQSQPHFSPQSWDTLAPEETQFRPYSLPRGMREGSHWAAGPIRPHQHQQLQTPSVPRILFGSAEPDSTETRDHAMDLSGFYGLDQSESRDQTPDFSRIKSETEEQHEDELFRGFSKFGGQAAHIGKETSKIYLKQESPLPRPQDVIETPSGGPDPDSLTQQHFSCSNVSSSCQRDGHGSGESSPSYSPRGGHFSQESDEEGSSSSSSLHTVQPLSEETLVPSLASEWSPGEVKYSGSCSCDSRDVGNSGYSERPSACPGRNYRQKVDGSHDRSVPSHPPSELQPPGEHSHKMVSDRTRDTGTQTSNRPNADASTQCSPGPESNIHNLPDSQSQCYTAHNKSKPLVLAAGSVIPPPASRGCAGLRYEAVRQQGHEVPSDSLRQQQEEYTPWKRQRENRAGQLSIKPVNKRVSSTESRVHIQRPATPTLDDLIANQSELGRQKSQGGDGHGREVDPAEKLEEAAQEPGPPTIFRSTPAKPRNISLIPTTAMLSSSTGSTTTSHNTTTPPTVPASTEAETAMALVLVLACAHMMFQNFLLC